MGKISYNYYKLTNLKNNYNMKILKSPLKYPFYEYYDYYRTTFSRYIHIYYIRLMEYIYGPCYTLDYCK